MQLKEHLIRSVVRSPIEDIKLLNERIEPFDLFSDEVAPFISSQHDESAAANFRLGDQKNKIPTFTDVFEAFGSTQAMDIIF